MVCTVADIVSKEKLLPQQIIVQNRAGGGGAVGQNYVASKRGDPYVFIEDMLAKVHKSAGWRDYMARWLAEQKVEMTQFLTEMGLALKK